jgi:hypothetical protein
MKLKNPHNAIILASEITKGMKSVGSKALLSITNSVSIIDYQIHILKKFYSPINIYICTGFDHEKLVKKTNRYKDIHYVYNPNYINDNQAAALSLCFNEYRLDDAIVLSNGILLGEKPVIQRGISSVFLIDSHRKAEFDIGSNSNNMIDYLFYDLPYKWIECAYLNRESIDIIVDLSKQIKINKLFLFELINIIAEKGDGICSSRLSKNMAMKINSLKDLTMAKKYYDKHLCTKIQ